MACLDNIYYKLGSNSAWLIALGMYLKIEDTSHNTAFLSEGDTEILYGESQSIPLLFAFLLHIAVQCTFDLILNLMIKSRSKMLRISMKTTPVFV